MDYNKLKKNVSHRLIDLGFSQRKLAAKMGLDPASFSKALSGDRKFTWQEVFILCDILQSSQEDLGFTLEAAAVDALRSR